MKEIFYNYDNLKPEDIDEKVIRTKALIVNSKNEITLGYAGGAYMFPGGHLEEGETLEACVLREIREETGIVIKDVVLKPFMLIKYYSGNYRGSGKNRENDIYYYVVETEEKFDMANSQLDERERSGDFCVKVFKLDEVDKVLIDSIPDNPINEGIVSEMLEALKEYRKIKSGRQ